MLHDTAIVFGNLETPLSNRGHPANKPIILRTDPVYVSELKKINLRVANLANNHILDYGTEAMFDTIEHLTKQNILYVGAGENRRQAAKPVVVNLRSQRISFIGAASTLPPDFAANEMKPGILPIKVYSYIRVDPELEQEQPGTPPFIYTEPDDEDLNYVSSVIEQAKEQSDYVILGIHWGVPFQNNVLHYQVKVADVLTKTGVDLIIGHHPHTLHGVARINGQMVFYSLGNFVFHYTPDPKLVAKFSAIMGKMKSSPYSMLVGVSFSEPRPMVGIMPICLTREGNPRLAVGEEVEKIVSMLSELSSGIPNCCSFSIIDDDVIIVE